MLQTMIRAENALSEIVDPDFSKPTSPEVDNLAPPAAVWVMYLSNQAAAAAADAGLSCDILRAMSKLFITPPHPYLLSSLYHLTTRICVYFGTRTRLP